MSGTDITFDYHLPKRLIAQEPLASRADARLLLVDRTAQSIEHRHVRDLPEILRAGDRLVLNDTKVIPAALQGVRTTTGGQWRGLYLHELPERNWNIVCKTRGRLQPGEAITLVDRDLRPVCKLWLLDRNEDGSWIAHPDTDLTVTALLQRVGRVPLPHYIRGGRMVDADVQHYQTVYARRPGAVAAPTAGLHFTEQLLAALEKQAVASSSVTLHVGLGTFRPILSDSLDAHQMHCEACELTDLAAQQINATRTAGGRIVAVGTTVVRVLESVVRVSDADRHRHESDPVTLAAWNGSTDLFIRPPFQFRAVDVLMTNFHFPRTTLLVLVQTFGGPDLIRKAYEEAIREEYRFYSYGDAMLII